MSEKHKKPTGIPVPQFDRHLGATVTAKCVQCGHKREIHANEVPAGMMPICDRDGCYGVMVVHSMASNPNYRRQET